MMALLFCILLQNFLSDLSIGTNLLTEVPLR